MSQSLLEVQPSAESFEAARDFVKKQLEKNKITGVVLSENLLVFEELFIRIIDFAAPGELLYIAVRNGLDGISLKFEFIGARLTLYDDVKDVFDPGIAILNNYDDKISRRYNRGLNKIILTVSRALNRVLFFSFFAVIAAVIAFLIINAACSQSQITSIVSDVVYPFELGFTQVIIMLSAPVTFCSIVTNLTNCSMVNDRHLKLRKLILSIILSSVIAMIVAVVLSYCASLLIGKDYSLLSSNAVTYLESLTSIDSFIPSDIFNAFTALSPFPLILIGILTAIGMIMVDSHFYTLKRIADALYNLFSKMLTIVMIILPAAAFCSILDVLLSSGYRGLASMGLMVLVVIIGVAVIIGIYGIRLAAAGVRPVRFFRAIGPAIVENLKINSTIDALQYNFRFCNRKLGIDKKLLNSRLQILANMNLDGNCFVLVCVSLIVMLVAGVNIQPLDLILLMILTLGLSFGAPNQPGSTLIGLLIIFSFFGIDNEYRCVAIYLEVFVGMAITLINTMGDIVTVTADAKKEGSCDF